MRLRDIRELIFCPCEVVVGNFRMLINTHMPSKYDNYEVIGIRVGEDNDESCVVLSLKEVATDSFQGFNLSTIYLKDYNYNPYSCERKDDYHEETFDKN